MQRKQRKVPVSITIDTETYAWIKKAARNEGVSVSHIVRRSLKPFFEARHSDRKRELPA